MRKMHPRRASQRPSQRVSQAEELIDAKRADQRTARVEIERLKRKIVDLESNRGLSQAERESFNALQRHLESIEARLKALHAGMDRSLGRWLDRTVRSVWRAVRRRRFEFKIIPSQHLHPDPVRPGTWISTGVDPAFELTRRSRRFPVKWVRAQMPVRASGGLRGKPILYVNSGAGYLEVDRIELARPSPIIDDVFRLPDHVEGLRFDPAESKGQFELGTIWIREVSKLEAGLVLVFRFITQHVAQPRDIISLMRWARAVHANGGWPLLKLFVSEPARIKSSPISPNSDYDYWLMKYGGLSAAERKSIQERIKILRVKPKISVLMPVYNTDPRWVRAAIKSVQAQLYSNWELCISDDASTRGDLRRQLRGFAKRDIRIRLHFRDSNGHISVNSNSALALASGDFIALLDADDAIPEDALYRVVEEINAYPEVDLIFSDEDKIDHRGNRFDPLFKPDWNPALMLSQNAFAHLGVYRRTLVEKVKGFRLGFEGSQDHDLVLRCSRETTQDRIRHIPRILYHWRAIESSTATAGGVKPYAWDAGRRAIEEHLLSQNVVATIGRSPLAPLYYQVDYPLQNPRPRVSILIPTTGKPEFLKPCLDSIMDRRSYRDCEILLLVNEAHHRISERTELLTWATKQPDVRVLIHTKHPFNFSWTVNWGAGQTTGKVLCLLNDDTEIITDDWLEQLVARVSLAGVAAVGPMMYFPDDTIQHSGVILGIGGVAAPVQGAPRGSLGYFSRACIEQDFSCVTAGCMVIRKEAFDAIGGFREQFAIAFNDVDFCLRLKAAGWRIVWTPNVEVYHHESVSIGRHNSPERQAEFAKETALMRKFWGTTLDRDPNYNINLSLEEPFRIAFPPRPIVPA